MSKPLSKELKNVIKYLKSQGKQAHPDTLLIIKQHLKSLGHEGKYL